DAPANLRPLARDLLALGAREADEVRARFPKVQRRVGGYNLDALVPGKNDINLAHVLVGSEGTLGFSTRIELKLSPLLGRRAVGAVHFGSFYEAMNAAQHIVRLKPIAVELIDRTMIELAGEIAMFRPTLKKFVRGEPAAILLVEFGEEDQEENLRRLKQLKELIGDLGFGCDKSGVQWGGVVEVLSPELQAAITDLRTSGLNIMMSMKEQGKPVSFVEDCAVPLEHLADYTSRLTAFFEKYGTRGTWYAHAGSGCLHVRPVLNLRLEKDVHAMRAIAEEAFAMVREYKGSHSGEHGDGLVRSEFNEPMFGTRLARAFEQVKDRFDPNGLYNPGKVVRPPKFDDPTLLRYAPGYHGEEIATQFDWSAYSGAGGGFQGAVEMCNNNGACRKLAGGVMCPSYRVTRDERDVTRGRANTLRLAITGQLGPDALASDEMMDTLALCVSCKACRSECPTGVDMARMKIEAKAAYAAKHGHSLHERLVGSLPRYAPYAARWPWLANLRDALPPLRWASELIAGFSARRSLPKWRADIYQDRSDWRYPAPSEPMRDVVLFADCFNRYFERENLDAARRVLVAGGYRVHAALPADGDARPLCCGRTFLSVGQVDEARREMRRTLDALAPYAARGVPVVGLEPSCLLSFRDELPALIAGETASALAEQALLFEEFLAREQREGRLNLPLGPLPKKALLHGHCHQKSFDAMGAVESVLKLIPELSVQTVESSCCGMAGAFGYAAATIDVSLKMAELSLLPAVRKAPDDALIVADGTSCRHQIHDGAERDALHVARVLEMSVGGQREVR
ncbi:MAG: 4Fe-4S dicluster domain-containing protein, partial [Rhizobiales bacterium]|nr:4Fe-4S dicluster domain-containing protein [Hyphomicrobiales bacterium]